jgi:hypothetical protein
VSFAAADPARRMLTTSADTQSVNATAPGSVLQKVNL